MLIEVLLVLRTRFVVVKRENRAWNAPVCVLTSAQWNSLLVVLWRCRMESETWPNPVTYISGLRKQVDDAVVGVGVL
jgi:hypothetical protein